MARSHQEIKKILRLYKTLEFPGSFSSARKFKRALKDHAKIEISLKDLEAILNNDLTTQMSKVKPLNPKMRHVISTGVTVQGQVDVVFVHLIKHQTLAEKKANKKNLHPSSMPSL